MLDKINDSSGCLSIKNQVFGFIQKLIGESVFWGFKNLINFDWISFVIIFDSEQKNCWEDEAQYSTGEKYTTTERTTAHSEFSSRGMFLSLWNRSLNTRIYNWLFLFIHFLIITNLEFNKSYWLENKIINFLG